MTPKQLLKELGIEYEGDYVADTYEVPLADSNAWSKVYSKLEKSEILDDTDDDILTLFNSSYTWLYEDYAITLLADFDKDSYKLVISNNN